MTQTITIAESDPFKLELRDDGFHLTDTKNNRRKLLPFEAGEFIYTAIPYPGATQGPAGKENADALRAHVEGWFG